MGRLDGHAVIVQAELGDVAAALAAEGAVVIVVGDADVAGAVAARVPGRAAVFDGSLEAEADRAALIEMVGELFAPPESAPPESAPPESAPPESAPPE